VICSCGCRVYFTPANVVGPAIFSFAYLLLLNCVDCGSTRAAVLWEAENEDIESEEQPLAAE
jgi:hypothetical protein